MASSNRDFIPARRQTALDFLVGSHFLEVAMDSFLNDRKARNRSARTIKFYRNDLQAFAGYCRSQAVTEIGQVDPALLRSYLLAISESRNAGGVHAAYRSLRAFFRWIEREELMPSEWRNPMHKVDAPFVPEQILEPVGVDAIQALVAACKGDDFFDKRDRAILFFLLDSGVRAQELCDIDLEDVELSSGQVTIRQGKGRKPRYVFIEKTSIRSLRSYLRMRTDHQSPALFVSKSMQRLTYDGLRQIIERRARKAGLRSQPTLHAFRRQFALSMLNNGADIFSLQRLMGHSDVSILRRYLAQTSEDLRAAHQKYSPVEKHPWA